jgi:type I site-specific restriction-modification system R (restriction) subunit
LFGFTGTPIFAENASYTQNTGEQGYYKTTADIFQRELHAYTITHAIEDRNVLRFLVEYYKPEGKGASKLNESMRKRAIVEAYWIKQCFYRTAQVQGVVCHIGHHSRDRVLSTFKEIQQSARRRTAIMSR